jgi:hypothetical protein
MTIDRSWSDTIFIESGNMPAMLRFKGRATKIAYSILGKPDNMIDDKKSSKEKQIDRRLIFEETTRVR